MEKHQPSFSSSNRLLVHLRQQKNPILRFVRKLSIDFSDEVAADFMFNDQSCGLFISLRYFRLYPDYLSLRMGEVPSVPHRVVICLKDEEGDIEEILSDLNFLCCFEKFALVLASSKEEAAQCLESFTTLGPEDVHMIRERLPSSSTPVTLAEAALSSLPGVSKTDVWTLLQTMGSVKDVVEGKV